MMTILWRDKLDIHMCTNIHTASAEVIAVIWEGKP
jgi:hypothetical protein